MAVRLAPGGPTVEGVAADCRGRGECPRRVVAHRPKPGAPTRPCCTAGADAGRCRGDLAVVAGTQPQQDRAHLPATRSPSISRALPCLVPPEPGGEPRAFASLVIAGIAFCGSHTLLSSTRLRGSLRDQIGEQGFLVIYSLTALVTFAWFVVAYPRAPIVPVWPPPPWTAWVPVAVMPLATLLLVAGYSTPNPTAVGMERWARADDPAPGILRVTRHPVMWALGLWALSHLAANGDLCLDVVFRRHRRAGAWRHRADRPQKTARARQPLAAAGRRHVEHPVCRPRHRPHPAALARHRRVRPLAALLLYAVLFLAHPIFTGVPVMVP